QSITHVIVVGPDVAILVGQGLAVTHRVVGVAFLLASRVGGAEQPPGIIVGVGGGVAGAGIEHLDLLLDLVVLVVAVLGAQVQPIRIHYLGGAPPQVVELIPRDLLIRRRHGAAADLQLAAEAVVGVG